MRGFKLRLLLFLCVMNSDARPGGLTPPTDYRLVCAGQRYDPEKEDCLNGSVVNLTTTSSSSVSPMTSTFPQTPANIIQSNQVSPAVGTCVRPEDVPKNRCNEQNLCGGFQCCGSSNAYSPHNSTCCKQLGNIKIFHGNKEKDYVCCYDGQITVHRRGTQPCLDASLNDKLFKKPLKFKEMNRHLDCKLKFAYLIKALKMPSKTDTDFRGTLEFQQVYPQYLNQTVFEKPIEFDKYSPIKPVEENSLLVMSTVDQTDINRFEFFVYSKDQIYKIPFCSSRPKRLYNQILRNIVKNKCTQPVRGRSRRHGKRIRSRNQSNRLS